MNVLYGLCGDGMGHAMRSAVVGRHLERQGHRLLFMASGGALGYLQKRWPEQTVAIASLGAVMVNNRVSIPRTLIRNFAQQKSSLVHHFCEFAAADAFRPDVVVNDYDPWTARFAELRSVPIVAVDNIHFLNRCAHPPHVGMTDRLPAALFGMIADQVVPSAGRYLVTSFVQARVSAPRTTLHLPILREEILGAKGAKSAPHVVAYFNDKADHAALLAAMGAVPIRFRVYGRKGLTAELSCGNVTFCPFSDAAFIADVATATAVIGGAGFTFMTEAIYLGKPMLALPFGNHFEQMLNANYLEALGYGERCRGLTPVGLRTFLARVPAYAEKLKAFRHDGNRELLAAVDQAVGAAGALPRKAAAS